MPTLNEPHRKLKCLYAGYICIESKLGKLLFLFPSIDKKTFPTTPKFHVKLLISLAK